MTTTTATDDDDDDDDDDGDNHNDDNNDDDDDERGVGMYLRKRAAKPIIQHQENDPRTTPAQSRNRPKTTRKKND